jgi:hypothetical protein
MKIRNRREQGQVIYLLAVGIITLLGFTALAIDGARLFSERRNAQGVADTAAFTAASYIGQYTTPYIESNWNPSSATSVDQLAESAALERVRSNGYTDSLYNPWGGNDRLRITITKVSETLATKYKVDVFLISEVEPIFAQVIYDGPMLVNVESTAIVMPRTNIGFGQAMYSLSDDACNALTFSGNSDVFILGSGIYANSTCTPNAINFSGTADMDVSGYITTPGGIDVDGGAVYTSGGDSEGVEPQSFRSFPPPDCSGMAVNPPVVVDTTTSPTQVIFEPGIYTGKINITSGANEQIFKPGLYCINGGLAITNGNITAHDVTFYVPTADVKITGGVLDMIAPRNGLTDASDQLWDGMLFFVAEGSWEVTGAAGTSLEGTVYAPGTPDPTCKLTGSGITDGYNLQLVCTTISLIGGAGLNITFDNSNAWDPPVAIDLLE